jgi:hypothetical protein
LNGEWTEPTDIIYTGEGGYTVRNALDVSSDGIIYALYRDTAQHRFSSAPAEAAQIAANWSQPVDFLVSYYLDLLVDRNDVIHIVESSSPGGGLDEENLENHPCAFCGDLIYRRSTDRGKSWEDAINLSELPFSGTDRPDIWQGKSGRIYVSWDEGVDWYAGRGRLMDVRVVYSEDEGETWSSPVILDGGNIPDKKPVQIAVGEMPDESLLAVWRYGSSDRNIYFQISSDLGKTWTKPEAIPGILARHYNETPLDDYELIVDLTGVAHLFFSGTEAITGDDPTSLYEIEFRQNQWMLPRLIARGEEASWPEWPKADVGPQNDIHLTWFMREDWYVTTAGSAPKLQVYYAYRSPSLPDRPIVAFAPTATLAPTQTSVPVFEPTITPFPTVAPFDQITYAKATRDMYATQTLLGTLLACVGLCGAVFVIRRLT